MELLSESYHLRLDHAALSLTIAAQFLRCRRRSSLVTAVRFSNGQGVLSIDYSGSKYARFTPKIATAQRALFRVVENGEFLNRLRNGHLEKSAATGLFRPSRSPMTAKVSLKVHLRLRFQNRGNPALRGFEAGPRALATAALYLLYFRTGISPHKTPSKPVSTPLEGAMI